MRAGLRDAGCGMRSATRNPQPATHTRQPDCMPKSLMIFPHLLLLTVLLAGCGDEPAAAARPQETNLQAEPAATPDPLLQHHQIRADQMPAPYATASSGNPPRVLQQPAGATLHLPPGFHISIFASGLVDPRGLA